MGMPKAFAYWVGKKRPLCSICGDPIWSYRRLGFLRCNDHIKVCCPLMKIPAEIRLMIYQHLLPNKPIQSLEYYDQELLGKDPLERESGIFAFDPDSGTKKDDFHVTEEKLDRKWTITTPLLVCKGMKAEYEAFLYSQSTFCINTGFCSSPGEQTFPWAAMCNENGVKLWQDASQFMRRVTEEEYQQTNVINPSRSLFSHDSQNWYPRLAKQYFKLIRHFQISITFHDRTRGSENPAPDHLLFEYTDYLHAVVTRLKSCTRIKSLTIDMHFRSTGEIESRHHGHAQILLEPFRRLNNILHFQVRSIYGNSSGTELKNILKLNYEKDWKDLQVANKVLQNRPLLNDFIFQLRKDIQRKTDTPPPDPRIFQLYWKLANEVNYMKTVPSWLKTNPRELGDLLRGEREARELNDFAKLEKAWERFMTDWKDWHTNMVAFLTTMDQSLGTVTREVGQAASTEIVVVNVD